MTPPRFQLAILLPTSLLLGLSNAEPITYSRGDKNAYLTARGEAVDSLDPLQNKTIRAQLLAQNNKSINHDDPITCTTYLAPSSIPNAGLGLYTSVSIPAETQLSSPQVGILLQDPDFHNPSRNDNNANTFNLLSNYVWSATPLTYGEHEVQHGESVCSGIGMMANCHYGLINVEIDSQWKNRPELDGTDSHSVMFSTHLTLEDVGRGSYSWHSNVQYKSLKGLEAGEEMFLSYGPQWYNNAEKEFGGYIPSKEHYEEADEMLTRFVEEFGKDNVVAYEKMIRYTQDKRLKTALPDRVEDAEKAIKGQVISTTPVVTLDREHLKLFKEIQRKDGTVRRKHVGHQLLLNYCYGHPKSSLIFFPTSPSVSFINHAADRSKANAEIKWSDFSYHKSEWINAPLAEIKKLQKTGLLFDIVATKEIERGDEILLYYGQEWEEKWTSHIANWESSQKNLTDTLDVDTIVDFNSIEKDEMIKTIDELEEEPLPEHIMTRCGFALPGDMKGDETVIKGYSAEDPIFVPCEFLDVEPLEGTDRYLYRAKVEHRSPQGDVTLYSVKYDSSQNFMRYTDKPYVRDYYSKGAFRNEIGLSEGILPAHWLDLK
ncbi:hypothetical protein ACHAXN_007858 [Cyclotella atomus]